MDKQSSDKEILIEYLLKIYEDSTSNEVSIAKSDLPNIPLSPKHIIKTIYLLKEDGLLTIVRRPTDDDFNIYWTVALKSSCIDYFENKESKQKEQKLIIFNEIRAWLTLAIALAAFIHSVYAANPKSSSLEQVEFEPVVSVSDNQFHNP
jgi:hypothetical protein